MGKMRLSDAGSVDGDEKLSVTIDPATSVMFFDLYVVNEAIGCSASPWLL